MIDKINTNQIRDILDKTAPQQPDSPKTPADNQVDASLQVDYAALIESAKQAPENDAQALQQARELLASGQLDTIQNISAAAENIINYGI